MRRFIGLKELKRLKGLKEFKVERAKGKVAERGGVWDCPPTLNVHQSAMPSMTMAIGGRAGRDEDWDCHWRWWTLMAMGVGGHCQSSAFSAFSA